MDCDPESNLQIISISASVSYGTVHTVWILASEYSIKLTGYQSITERARK
jgi:hypothetical protein